MAEHFIALGSGMTQRVVIKEGDALVLCPAPAGLTAGAIAADPVATLTLADAILRNPNVLQRLKGDTGPPAASEAPSDVSHRELVAEVRALKQEVERLRAASYDALF